MGDTTEDTTVDTSALPFVLGIFGDSGSGKSTLADGVRQLLGPERVAELKLDDYHRYTRAERAERRVTALNPAVHNLPLLREHLGLLRGGRPVRSRSYNHADGTFGPVRMTEPRPVVLARGLLGLPTDELRAAYDLAVFLAPEPDLLFRWKLRRNMLSRGYTQAEVLLHIAQHVLDAKEFIAPQEARADVVVRHEVAEWDAPDETVRTSVLLRGAAAEAVRAEPSPVPAEGEGEALVLRLPDSLPFAEVETWGRSAFPDTYDPATVGAFLKEGGGTGFRADIAFLQVLVARLVRSLREHPSSAGGA